MSWYIYDSSGYIGDLASNRGLKDLSDYIKKVGEPKLKSLFDDGWTRTGTTLNDNLEIIPMSGIVPVDKTLEHFKELLLKCQDVVIITDGALDPEMLSEE